MDYFNKMIYENIKQAMKEKNITTYSLERDKEIKRSTVKDKITRLKYGEGITTTSLFEIAELLEVSVCYLVKKHR